MELEIACVAFMVLEWVFVWKTSYPSKEKLTFSQKLLAFWYIFNGIVIHCWLDGMVGLLGLFPPLYEQYGILDSRYPDKDPYVMAVSAVELLIMHPLCLAAFHALLQKKPQFHPLQILVSSLQLMGCLIFTFGEVLMGFKHVVRDGDFSFTPEKIFYFYIFFVLANMLWTFLPSALIYNSVSEIAKSQKSESKKAK
eukprot:TRINITY_DN4021_c0_g1_i1.p1 TRINITY_DN4021_c0_g1~~TRINITY_DN4021_c0_g1_i1.p1  ORF type:complete len:196 (+),score=44.65 TRINITY_DN4021_c0_g1_i1:54-641(+)